MAKTLRCVSAISRVEFRAYAAASGPNHFGRDQVVRALRALVGCRLLGEDGWGPYRVAGAGVVSGEPDGARLGDSIWEGLVGWVMSKRTAALLVDSLILESLGLEITDRTVESVLRFLGLYVPEEVSGV